MPPVERSRRWVYTLHNYNNEHEALLQALDTVYHVYGREVCPTTGTPHLQGFLVLPATQRLSYLVNRVTGAHWATAKGRNDQAAIYCKKDGNFTETGEMPGPVGKSTAMDNAIEW